MSAQRERPRRQGNTDLLLEAVTRALLLIIQALDDYRGITRPRFVDKRAQNR